MPFRGACFVLLALLAAPGGADSPPDPARLLAEQRAAKVASEVRSVQDVTLTAGPASLRLESGQLFAVTTATGAETGEWIFRGAGRLSLTAPDDLEASQLELFAGSSELDVPFAEAVFVFVAETAAPVRALATTPAPAGELEAARTAHTRWVASRERQLLGVPLALWRLGLGERPLAGYFAASLATADYGRMLLLLDPEDEEQFTLGRFAPLDLDRKEERKLRRRLHREQRRGRLVGLDLEDLGPWDTWTSFSVGESGRSTFEPRHYHLEVDVRADGHLSGKMEVELVATHGGARTVSFTTLPDCEIRGVRDAGGAALPHALEPSGLVVLLPHAPAAGEAVTVALDFGGPLLARSNSHQIGGDVWYLPHTTAWYPHTGTVDRATYEAEIKTAIGTVMAPGAPADARPGKTGRFLVQRPTFGFTFEVGSFKTFTATAGETPITLHLGSRLREADMDGEVLIGEIRKSLEYLEEIFGPLPFERLTAVSGPRGYSQSFPGYLLLADDMMIPYPGNQDPRTVIAHELAHQWWGHKASFTSYRDQWLSEALATYASALYGREKLERRYFENNLSPTEGWQNVLTRITATGEPLESVGPVVLGGRLDSSKADGYVPIVYWKGGLVVDMLHSYFGAKTFLPALRKILTAEQGDAMTTAEFLAGLEKHAGGDVDEIAKRFVYGVGLPEVYYGYDFAKEGEGRWTVSGTARQQAPYHYRYRLQPQPGGIPDVVRETISRTPVSSRSRLAVPVEIGILQANAAPPAQRMNRAERKAWEEKVAREGNATLVGRTLLEGAEAKFSFDVPAEPRVLWFDRHAETYCVFYDERRFPKRTVLYRGIDQAAAGRVAEAEASFRAALGAPLSTDPPAAKTTSLDEYWTRAVVEFLDRETRLRLARLYLDLGRLADAETELTLAKGGERGLVPLAHKHEERTLEARLALRQGRPERTLALLAGSFTKRQVESREGQALLAVAAWAAGDTRRLADARREAERGGVDLSLLDTPRSR